MLTLVNTPKNQELVSKLIATKKRLTQKSAIVAVAHKGYQTITAINNAAAANNMQSILIDASQLHKPDKLQELKNNQIVGLVLIVLGISNANIKARALLNELIVNIYAGIPTWLHPESQLVVVDYIEDHTVYQESALESAAISRATTVQLFSW